MGEHMTFKTYNNGDEGSNKLCLFNSSELYSLNSDVVSVFENGKVVAFIDYFFDDQTLFITAFETIQKNTGAGTRIISYFKSCDDVQRIIVQPLMESIPFWTKMQFVPSSKCDWIWVKQRNRDSTI